MPGCHGGGEKLFLSSPKPHMAIPGLIFKKAIAERAYGTELDVYMIKDSILWLYTMKE